MQADADAFAPLAAAYGLPKDTPEQAAHKAAVLEAALDGAVAERLNKLVEMAGTQRDRAKEERDAVKALISDITHQVRTPLSNIMLYTDSS